MNQQNLALFTVLSLLLRLLKHLLPIVVDTPLAGFGRGMAVAWQQVVQRTFDQTIALINSSEKGSLEEWWSVGGRQIQMSRCLPS